MMLNNKIALVTGAGKASSSAIARKLSQNGAKVYIHRSSKETAEALASEIEAYRYKQIYPQQKG